jgi:hypothetical protein
MTAKVIPSQEFHGRWLAAQMRRLSRQRDEMPPLQRALCDASEVLCDCGIDLNNRKKVKRTLADSYGATPDDDLQFIPPELRNNRAAYEAFIDAVIEIARREQEFASAPTGGTSGHLSRSG